MTQEQRLYLSTQLVRIGQFASISEVLSDVLLKEKFVGFGTKQAIRGINHNMKTAQNRLVSILSDKSKKENSESIMDEESVLQTCALIDVLMALPKGMRAQIEDYAMGIYNVYALNK